MPRVGTTPLTLKQRDALRGLVDRGDAGIRPSEALDKIGYTRATLRAIERRGFAVYKCDRKPGGVPVFGTWRYVATQSGILEAMNLAVMP
jgi:hypothetical protein